MIDVVSSAQQMRAVPRASGQRAVVMTMGALHDGHAELIHRARDHVGADGTVVVTMFVNPTQFGVGEDFEKYPRSRADDIRVCEEAGADVVFAPNVVDVYGNDTGFATDSVTIDPGPLGSILEGASRPGHFRGVLTVVAKLLALTTPDVAFYGQKDYQQLVLITRMVRDLNMPVEVIGVPTVCEPDGLARSSRNRYLSPEERARRGGHPAGPRRRRASAAQAGPMPWSPRDVRCSIVPTASRSTISWSPTPGWARRRPEGMLACWSRPGSGHTRLIDNDSCGWGRDAHREGADCRRPGWTARADVIVVGSGVAGLTAALRLRAIGRTVLLVTKAQVNEGSTRWAQGGIAAALADDDSPAGASARHSGRRRGTVR